MSKEAAKKIVVCGGNGFLGSRICKFAVARGWQVTSLSRSGEPKWSAVTSSASPPPWAHKVSWESADIFQPATYARLLQGTDYVVQSMGILLEVDYKSVLSGRESALTGLCRAFGLSRRASANPLNEHGGRSGGRDADQQQQLTYESMNRDAALAAATAASAAGVTAFLYVSAAAGAPVLPARYIETKRAAEAAIASGFPRMRPVFLRPPLLYDTSRFLTVTLAAATAAGALLNGVTGGVLAGFLGAAGVKPLQVDVVAQAAVEALSDEAVRGPVEVAEMEELATRCWRKGML